MAASPIILREFPLTKPGFDAEVFYQQFGRTNMLVDATSNAVSYAKHAGPLSIKCTFRGREIYHVDSGRVVVDPDTYLVLNEGQCYASEINSSKAVESFTVFFAPRFAREIFAGSTLPTDRLLDDPGLITAQPLRFFETLRRHDVVVTPQLLRLRQLARSVEANAGELEEQLHLLLMRLLRAHRITVREVERINAMRQVTRLEIYRRLLRARDFMEGNFARQIDLRQMAQAACLSPSHFLRLFKQAFGETPHQYLVGKRLRVAREWLLRTDQSVLEICLGVGFENASSFTRLFHRRFGLAPGAFRKGAI